LFIADAISRRTTFFFYTFLAILLWNACTTWWLWNSTDVGSIAAIVANSLLMCLPWWGYHIFKTRSGKKTGYLSLITFWMLFEYVHLNWQLSWPWLTLGNVFASHPGWVQWYEYTGVSGGTLWILLVNILLYEAITAWGHKKELKKKIIPSVIILLVPLLISAYLSFRLIANPSDIGHQNPEGVLIIQPNVDPYQKFESLSVPQQIQKLISLSEPAIDSSTRLILWPETALDAGIEQNQTAVQSVYQPVFDFVNRHPGITLLTGIETWQAYGMEKVTATARKAENGMYYDAFNAAVAIKAHQPPLFYHKSKLVPGVESMPSFLNFLAPLFEKFGGTTGGYGRDTAARVFPVNGSSYVAAPIICYESIYGEYVCGYVRKGATLLTIITNDGWWGNTPGHLQHLQYARLRAIETRKYVTRSANTGISAVIDDRGNILETQPWDKIAVISYRIPALHGQTFYVRYGDYLYKIAAILGVLLILRNIFLFSREKMFAGVPARGNSVTGRNGMAGFRCLPGK
jgi:apolipoprotein N-acyltransferase